MDTDKLISITILIMLNNNFVVKGHILSVADKTVIDGELHVKNGKIEDIIPIPDLDNNAPYILPGLIDAHVHIESSMLLPSQYAKEAVRHGVVGAVCDPHEIANVCGKQGVNFMIENSKQSCFHFAFTAPSCVPATSFETSGYTLNSQDVKQLLEKKEIYSLAEMMNFPGVLNKNEEVLRKIDYAKQVGKPTDGHAPMLDDKDILAYSLAGISTDHESSSYDEAETKIKYGIKCLIREGSAAKNFDNLWQLIDKYPTMTMFCSDDIHPNELQNSYIDTLVKRSIGKGVSLFNILQTSSLNPISHYNLPIGMLRKGDYADFIIVNNLKDFEIQSTFISGEQVFDKANNNLVCNDLLSDNTNIINNFNRSEITEKDIKLIAQTSAIKVIKAKDKELYTKAIVCNAKIQDNFVVSDTENDVLKLVVCNRYNNTKPAIAFINGFGLKNGAMASTIAHDSHNIIAVGTCDELIVKVINQLVANKGGICITNGEKTESLPLPIAGLMSGETIDVVSSKYESLNNFAKSLGCKMNAPFMTMAFMALLVIPEIKLSDKGLFDAKSFEFTSVFA